MLSFLRDAFRGSAFFLALAAFGASSFIGGTLASRSMRDPATLITATVMIGSLFALLWLGGRCAGRGGDRRA